MAINATPPLYQINNGRSIVINFSNLDIFVFTLRLICFYNKIVSNFGKVQF